MIKYIQNNLIDREKWDNCIQKSPGTKPYGYSWYLDIMAPGWDALVEGDYDSVFPVPGFRRFGISYIATPIFLQQLGVFSQNKTTSNTLIEFLNHIPQSFRLIDLCTGQKAELNGFVVTEKNNIELSLESSYKDLWNGFSSDCRRNVTIASKKSVEFTEDITPEELVNMFILNTGGMLKDVKPRDYNRLRSLMDYCILNNKGKIIGVRSANNELIFGVFLVMIPGSITVLFTSNTEESKKERIGYLLINKLIKENSSTGIILDFAGSSIPSIASFMRSFGSTEIPYYRIYQNRLPGPLRLMKE